MSLFTAYAECKQCVDPTQIEREFLFTAYAE